MAPVNLLILAAVCLVTVASADRGLELDGASHADGGVRVRATGGFERTRGPRAKINLLELGEISENTDAEPATTQAEIWDKKCNEQAQGTCNTEERLNACAWDESAPEGAKCKKVCDFPPCYTVSDIAEPNRLNEQGEKYTQALKAENEQYAAMGEDKTLLTKLRKDAEYEGLKSWTEETGKPEGGEEDLSVHKSKIGGYESHQDAGLKASGVYDNIRARLNRQEKMLLSNAFSVKKYAESGEAALNENTAYHGMLGKYVQGLYQMAGGANKLTHDTYIRHAGIATHLYDTVTNAKTYYDKKPDGIEATVHNTNDYAMMAHHTKALDDFKEKSKVGGDSAPMDSSD